MVNDDVIADFARDGVVVVRGLVDPALVADIADERSLFGPQESSVVEAAKQFCDVGSVAPLDQALDPAPSPSNWVQDRPLLSVKGRGVSAIVVTKEVSKEASPEFWAGSQLGPNLLSEDVLKDWDLANEHLKQGSVGRFPDIDSDPSSFDIRQWQLSAGDVLFYDFGTVYRFSSNDVLSDSGIHTRYCCGSVTPHIWPWSLAKSPEGL